MVFGRVAAFLAGRSLSASAFRRCVVPALFLLCGTFLLEKEAQAQGVEQETGLRFSATVAKKFNKQFKVFLNPELRTEGVSPDRYLIEAGLNYEPFKYLEFTPGYRFEINEKKEGWQRGHRLRFDTTGKLPLGDFTPNFRLRYSASFSPEETAEQRLRYKLGLDYDPTKRWSASIAAELFQDIVPYELNRIRYSAGVGYKFHRAKKKNIDQTVLFKYRLDYYLHEYVNAHIFELGYKFAF